ncbi:hypothetical protein B0J13DRAFT_556069 [Dactylonectria estremocensis]|uniref:Uncharacterized protein n=1 Tax=Dactylonectria estremocensis TaxID=1079267 RepID=A0A9P9EQT7_9HYPO|nr:hypothetical protein B0J13DRAFT_556069 [Dactylonectria estremocensis]
MQTKAFITALLAALPAIQAFKFTGPDPSKVLDVSKEITITWSGGVPDNLPRKLDFGWHCEPDQLNTLESDISQMKDDIYLSDGEYKIKFGDNFHRMLDEFADKLAKDKLFTFQAIFNDRTDDRVVYWSQNYTLTGLNKRAGLEPEVEL